MYKRKTILYIVTISNTTDVKENPDDNVLCERYKIELAELNKMFSVWEKMLLLRDLPEPKGWKKEQKETKSVKDIATMLKDSPLIRMAMKMKPKKEKSELLDFD